MRYWQIWPWSTEWSWAKANRVFPRECTGHSKNTLFRQHKRRLYTWTSPDGQHQNQVDYILCSQRQRSSIQSAKTRLGADCGSGPELLIAKFRLKLKKVGETTRPFRYDLNQIPYGYTVEVRNRFKGLNLTECLKNYGWRFVTLYRRQGSRPSPRKRNAKNVKKSEEALKTAVERREAKEKRKDTPIFLDRRFSFDLHSPVFWLFKDGILLSSGLNFSDKMSML